MRDGTQYKLFQNPGTHIQVQVKRTAGYVSSLMCHNLNAAARYVQLHAVATALVGGEVPEITVYVPAGTSVTIGADFFSHHGIAFRNGIRLAFSTTEATFTAGVAADQVSHVVYR